MFNLPRTDDVTLLCSSAQ